MSRVVTNQHPCSVSHTMDSVLLSLPHPPSMCLLSQGVCLFVDPVYCYVKEEEVFQAIRLSIYISEGLDVIIIEVVLSLLIVMSHTECLN